MDTSLLKLGLTLNVSWFDCRLQFKFLDNSKKKSYINSKSTINYWKPPIRVLNAIDSDKLNFVKQSSDSYIWTTNIDNGTQEIFQGYSAMIFKGKHVEMKQILISEISVFCRMNQLLFPFDTQVHTV